MLAQQQARCRPAVSSHGSGLCELQLAAPPNTARDHLHYTSPGKERSSNVNSSYEMGVAFALSERPEILSGTRIVSLSKSPRNRLRNPGFL